MRILLVGATGTIGRAVAAALSKHDLILASHRTAAEKVELGDPASIRALLARVGQVDAIASAAGSAAWKPFAQLDDADFDFSLRNKLMGQVNLARYGLASVKDGGSITLTGGYLAHQPMVGGGAVSLVNAGLEGFTRAAALEAPRGIRVNIVSPPWVSETLTAMGQDPKGGLPAAVVARSYVQSIEGRDTGRTITPS